MAASGEEPSRMRAVPFAILVFQSADAGVAGGATKISADAAGPSMWPAGERMDVQAPDGGPRTVKVPAEHIPAEQSGAKRTAAIERRRNLFCDCIPDACAEVPKIRTMRIAFIAEIDA